MSRVLVGLALLMSEPAPAQLNTYFSVSDYPPAAFKEGREGTVEFEAIVNIDGRLRDCRIVQTSGHSDLDETTCRLLTERLRFRPAKDSAGNSVEDKYSGKITWRIQP